MAKLLPHTQKTVYPLNSSCVIIPFEFFHYWLGLVITKGSFLIEYVYPEKSGTALDNLILTKGDKHHADVGDYTKRQLIYLKDRETPYSAEHPYRYTALEEGSTYVCLHQTHKFLTETQNYINSQNDWPWPNIYDSRLVKTTINLPLPKDNYIYVADGSVKINGSIKNENEWVISGSEKIVEIEPINGEAVIALLR